MKIAVTDDYQNVVRTLDCFRKLSGHDVRIYHETEKDLGRLAARLVDAEALVLMRERTPITRSLLERLPRLKLISQTGRGIAHIDLDACTEHKVMVSAANISSPSAPAELTWGLILASLRHIPQEARRLKEGAWQTTLGIGLKGRTLGIFGYGRIGALVGAVGKAFDMRVLAWGREGSLRRARASGIEAAVSKEQLFEISDVLSLHLVLSAETRYSVRAEDLARMKPTALLVNTSRAELIAECALVQALQHGRPGFAAVDVYEDEPVMGGAHPLLHMDNAVCTPHLGVVEKDTYELYFGLAFDQVIAYGNGSPINILNPNADSKDAE